jgi:hypothetical protein
MSLRRSGFAGGVASHRAVQAGAAFGLAWILGLDVPDGLCLLSRRRACTLGLRLLARLLVFAAATLRRRLVCQGASPRSRARTRPTIRSSRRARRRACRGRVKQRSFLHARAGGHSRARPRSAGSPDACPLADFHLDAARLRVRQPLLRSGRAVLDDCFENGTSPAVDPVCLKGALPRRARRVLA